MQAVFPQEILVGIALGKSKSDVVQERCIGILMMVTVVGKE